MVTSRPATRQDVIEALESYHQSLVDTHEEQLQQMRQEVENDPRTPRDSMALPMMMVVMRDREEMFAREIMRLHQGGEIGQDTIAAKMRDALNRM